MVDVFASWKALEEKGYTIDMPESNADRFLDAFNRIEDRLRKVFNAEPDTGYNDMIGAAAQEQHSPIHVYQQRLIRFGYLRNAIVHNPKDGGEVIANPRDDIVQQIEDIANTLESPPTVDSFCSRDVYSVIGNQLVREVAHEMEQKDYSQAPVVYSDNTYRDLLTTNAVARWFAVTSHESDTIDVSEATVSDVLRHRESQRDLDHILESGASLFEVIDAFDVATDGNEIPPYAVVVTSDGSPQGTVKGIITTFDLPEVYRRIKHNTNHE
jgi:predicted transcriptional regulator